MAALLAQRADATVTIAARTRFDTLTVDTDQGAVVASPRIITRPECGEVSDWVIIATKAYDAVATARWLPALVGPGTLVAVLQNGVEHVQRFAGDVDESQLLPVVVSLAASRSSPGVFVQYGVAGLTVPDSTLGRQFADLCDGTAIAVTLTPDFTTQMWRKLALNVAGAISAATLTPVEACRDPDVARVMHAAVRECVAVARAEGAVLPDSVADEVVASYQSSPMGSVNSLHADRLAGRPMEIDARNGAVVRIGKSHGIPTPTNSTLVAILHAAQVAPSN